MDYNIVNIYIEYIKKKYLELFKILLRGKYQKEMCLPFVERYINVRYYNETNYLPIKDFLNRINRELVDLVNVLANDENLDDLKNIVALFGYIVYFDDVAEVTNDMELIDTLVEDDIIRISNKQECKSELKEWYIDFKKDKEKFHSSLLTKDFNLLEDRLYRKLYYLVLEHNVKISNLYSEYAVEKAYNSGTIGEDKLFITYILASNLVLDNAIKLDFSRYYMVSFASTLFEKEKKCARLLNVLNNPLTKKFVSIRITYTDYKNNKNNIDKLINEGYSFGLELDSKYTGETRELVLFPYILVKEDSEEYTMLSREKHLLKSKIIKI